MQSLYLAYGDTEALILSFLRIFGTLRSSSRQGHIPVPTEDEEGEMELKFLPG